MTRLIVARDMQALALLYDRHAALTLGLAVKILGDSTIAEEMLQEAFLRVWQRAETFQNQRGQFAGWLMGITRNLCLDYLRRRRRQQQAGGRGEQLEVVENAPDPEANVPDTLWVRERRKLVTQALNQLPPEQRQVIELAYFAGKTRRQIAVELNCPEGTVHTRARLGLARLRQELVVAGIGADE